MNSQKKKSTNIRTRGKILLKYIIENEIVKKTHRELDLAWSAIKRKDETR